MSEDIMDVDTTIQTIYNISDPTAIATIRSIYDNINDPTNKVKTFENVLLGATKYLEANKSIYNYDNQNLPKTIVSDEATTIIDEPNNTFTINLFTSVEFLSKIPGDGFHDFLTMGRNATFKDVKSEFIFIYILGNFMKNITCMTTPENKDNIIANTLYTYAAAMKLFNDKTDQMEMEVDDDDNPEQMDPDNEKMDQDVEAKPDVPIREKSARAAAAAPANYATSDVKDKLGDGNNIAHRVMDSKTTIMTGKGKCNKIGHQQRFKKDEIKVMNILYYVDNNGEILEKIYDSWVNLCTSSGMTLPEPLEEVKEPESLDFSIEDDRKKFKKYQADMANIVIIFKNLRSKILDETVREINIDTLFANAAPINTPEWYKIQYVKDSLEKYTKDYVNALYDIFTRKRLIRGGEFKPKVLSITTIPYLEKLDNEFLTFDTGLKDMEFDLAKLLFKERVPLYFFADANHGKVGPGILAVLRSHPVLLIESSVIDLDEASEGFSKTTQELNKFYNSTVSTSYETVDENSNIISKINDGQKFIFNFYSDDNCLIEQFVISESQAINKNIEFKTRVDELSKLSKNMDFTSLEEREYFIEAVLNLFNDITAKDGKMISSMNIDTEHIKKIKNKLKDRIKYMITDDGTRKFAQDASGNTVMVKAQVEIKKKGKSLTPQQFEEVEVPKVLNVQVNGAKFILFKMEQYLYNASSYLQITNRFVSTTDIKEISVNNMTNVAVQNLSGSMSRGTPTVLLKRLHAEIIRSFSNTQPSGGAKQKTPAPTPVTPMDQKDIIHAIQNFLIPLTAKRTGDLLPLCLWGFLKDKPNKFYDTGDLNAFQLGLLLLTSEKNVSLFQDLLLACPGTDEMQDFLRLVRCGNNDDFFSTVYTGTRSKFVYPVSLPNTIMTSIPKGSTIQKEAITVYIKPLHDCIPPIFNPTFVLNPDDPKDPCPKSFKEIQALNKPMASESPTVGSLLDVNNALNNEETLPEAQMVTETPDSESEAAVTPTQAAKIAEMNKEVSDSPIASGVPAPFGSQTPSSSLIPKTKRKFVSDPNQPQPQSLKKSTSVATPETPNWPETNPEAGSDAIKTTEGGQKRKKLKTIKKRNPKVQRKTIKIKTKTKHLK